MRGKVGLGAWGFEVPGVLSVGGLSGWPDWPPDHCVSLEVPSPSVRVLHQPCVSLWCLLGLARCVLAQGTLTSVREGQALTWGAPCAHCY